MPRKLGFEVDKKIVVQLDKDLSNRLDSYIENRFYNDGGKDKKVNAGYVIRELIAKELKINTIGFEKETASA